VKRVAIFAVAALFVVPGMVGKASAATCTHTGYVRDGIDLTAAQIGGTVTGALDATGCNIGVYFDAAHPGGVSGAEIFGANYFGVLDNGQTGLVVERSTIHDIGESPLNGAQHGVGIYFAFGSGSTGTIKRNTIARYQKGGIVVNGAGSSAQILGNTVTGEGPVGYTAQNGIQIGFGATGSIVGNTVTGNSYTGTSTDAAGILLAGGPGYGGDYVTGVSITRNTVTGNDVGIYLSNIDASFNAPAGPTGNSVVNNTISNDAVNNNYGGVGYQAGISDQGNSDNIVNNEISGLGYTPVEGDTPYLRFIDADPSFTNDAHFVNNDFE
jgi:hypothetical protein